MASNQVQAVDNFGTFKHSLDKVEAHRNGQLHLAFSVMVVRLVNNGAEFLLQKRADDKYHSGGLWSNSCCSHPLPYEDMESAISRRLREELGVTQHGALEHIGSIKYKLDVDDGMIEHEFDHLFLLRQSRILLDINAVEVSQIAWFKPSEIQKLLNSKPEKFTKWFPLVFEKFQGALEIL